MSSPLSFDVLPEMTSNTTTSAPAYQAPFKGATLLLVDDESGVLSALRRLFRGQGYTVLLASSGAEGLQILAQQPVDLVLSDMRMPEMDGAQFLAEVRQRHPQAVRLLARYLESTPADLDALQMGVEWTYHLKLARAAARTPADDLKQARAWADAYAAAGRLDEARKFWQKAEKSFEKQNDKEKLAAVRKKLAAK